MAPRIESFYELGAQPQCIAVENSPGAERVLVVCPDARRIVRMDLATGACETFALEGVSKLVDIAAAPAGGCYVVDSGKSIRRLDEGMATLAAVEAPDGFVTAVEALDDGFVAVVAHTNLRRSLVRYSDALEKLWSVELTDHLVPSTDVLRYRPVVPLRARGAERFHVAAAIERVALLQVPAPPGEVCAHEIPASEPRLFQEGREYRRSAQIVDGDTRKLQPATTTFPVFMDACSRPAEDALVLAEWGTWLASPGVPATGFYDCRYDESLGAFQTRFSAIEGSFLGIAALAGNRIAAAGRLTVEGERGIAVIALPLTNDTHASPS